MKESGLRNAAYGADKFGLKDLAAVHWNLTEAPLYEHAIRNGEAQVVAGGALCAETGHHIAQFMASHSTFKAGPWLADHFALYSSRAGGGGRLYTEEAAYPLGF